MEAALQVKTGAQFQSPRVTDWDGGKMKKRVFWVAALSVSFATGLLVGSSSHRSKFTAPSAAQALDPAFRDGVYQAKLDVREGRRPHFSTGRWSNASARASYVAGYQQGYRESYENRSGQLMEPSVAELAASGYRDGMLDGTWHRIASQPFQADQTANYRDAGISYLDVNANAERFKHFYREAYLNGYHQAFYSQVK
jgi:hypothetical protein